MTLYKLMLFTVATVLSLPGLADTLKMSGASTVYYVVVKPTLGKVQTASGHMLDVTTSNTGKGLVDLASGVSGIAMVSEPMDIALAAAAAAGKQIDPTKVEFFEARKDEVVFVVHPSNPVGKLSWEQIGAIHAGRIKNWKEVGGKDLPIAVYADALTGGTRAMIKKIVCAGEEFGASTRTQTAVIRVAELVASDPAGIGGVGKSFAVETKGKILDTKKLERPLGFATLGAPSPAAKAVIDGFIKEAHKM